MLNCFEDWLDNNIFGLKKSDYQQVSQLKKTNKQKKKTKIYHFKVLLADLNHDLLIFIANLELLCFLFLSLAWWVASDPSC